MPTLAELTTEINTDPMALGYATLKVQSNGPDAVAARLNELGAGGHTLFKQYTPMEDIIACVVRSEYDALSAAAKTFWDQVLTKGTRVKSGDANLRTAMAGVFGAGATRTALIASSSRSCSRAEFLWGEGTTISANDVAHVLNPEG